MIEINLVPDVKQELIRAERMRVQVIFYSIAIGIISLGVVLALCLYVYGVQFGVGVHQDQEIKDGYAKLSKTKDLSKILTIQNQLQQIPAYHNSAPVTSRVFDMLSSVDPPAGDPNNVTISQLTVDTTAKTIDIQAQTSGYPALETFQKTLKNAEVTYSDNANKQQTAKIASDFNLSNVSYSTNSDNSLVLNFELEFTYADALFSSQSVNPVTSITGTGNATDSYINLPKTLWQANTTATSGGGQ